MREWLCVFEIIKPSTHCFFHVGIVPHQLPRGGAVLPVIVKNTIKIIKHVLFSLKSQENPKQNPKQNPKYNSKYNYVHVP